MSEFKVSKNSHVRGYKVAHYIAANEKAKELGWHYNIYMRKNKNDRWHFMRRY